MRTQRQLPDGEQRPRMNGYLRLARQDYNRTYREDVQDAYPFDDLEQVREITDARLKTHNEIRSHDALGRQFPAIFRAPIETRNPTSKLST